MDIVVNLRNQMATSQLNGNNFNIVGKEIYDLFLSHLKKFNVDKLYLIIADEKDLLYSKIKDKYENKFKIEPVVSAKLSDASLLKRMIINKKLRDNFVYFSQLSLNDIDLQDLIDYHKYNDSLFTVALFKQPRSFTNFGYVYLNEEEKIQAFNYKWLDDSKYLGYINSGIYAISKKAIAEIQNNNNGIRLVDDLLKHIIYKKKRHFTYITNKYHNNLSTLEEYYNAHLDLLKGNVINPLVSVDTEQSLFIPKEVNLGKGFKYTAPTMISYNSSFGNNVTLVNSVIAGNAKIGNNVIIENSFIAEEVRIEDDCVIKNTYLWNQYIPGNSYIDGNDN